MAGANDEQRALAGVSEAELQAMADQAIAASGGDARAAVRASIIAIRFHEAELQALRREIASIAAAVSQGYIRRRLRVLARDEGR